MSDISNKDNIFGYIKTQEHAYLKPIRINRHWTWNMADHIELSELYKNSQIWGDRDDFTPVKNIVRPILNLQYRTEDIDVKDVQIYVEDADKYHLSLLVKKYHDDVFTVENDLDSFFDELNESRIDFGGGLSKKLNGPVPEVVPLQSIVFCDQTDLLSGPIGLKHFFSPDQLLEMGKVGWGQEDSGATLSLEDLIILSRTEKKLDPDGEPIDTPGKYVEVYEIHGSLPKKFANILPNTATPDLTEEYEMRMWIVAFYTPKDSKEEQGVILFSKIEKESPFKLMKRDNKNGVYGRALGFGGVEELFDAQIFTNYDMVRMQDMLDSASKTILKTTDPNVATRSKVYDMENNEIIELAPNTILEQVDTFPRNYAIFEKSLNDWAVHAQDMGAAQDPIQGKEPVSGTPFKSLEEQVRQGMGLHEFRRGKFAKHLEEIYKDWIIPHIQKQILKGTKFLSTLDMDELQFVSKQLVVNESNKMIKERILNGELVTQEEIELHKESVREAFRRKGEKHFIEVLKGEFKEAPLAVKINISGKQKNLAAMTDKLVNVFRFAFSNPEGFKQTMQIPGMAKAFNDLLEFSGISPVDFSAIAEQPQLQAPQGQKGIPEGAIKDLAPNAKPSTNQPVA